MKKFLLLIPSAFISLMLSAQFQNVEVAPAGYGVNEPSIIINPKDPSKMVAGSNIDYFHYSEDGGYTWSLGYMNSPYGENGDPCLIADTAGSIYYMHLSNPSSGSWIDRIVCQRSDDNGQTWNLGSFTGLNAPKKQDKEWAYVDPATNIIYMTWTQFDDYGSGNPLDSSIILFSKSADRGMTWSAPLRICRKGGDCLDMDNTVEGAVPAVGPNGEVYVSWAGPLGLVFNKSVDQGNTWMDTNTFVSDIPGGWDYAVPGIYRANGLPVTCCDLSNGPYRGNIYINWSDQRNGDFDTDIWFKKSSDGGNTWSELKRVNDDPAGRHQFFTWMTVDQVTGYIYIVFYDRRNHADNKTDVYMAVSKDGGDNFINMKISETPFNPDAAVFFGDYTNISAYNNIVRPIWTRLDETSLTLQTAIIDSLFAGTGEKPSSIVALSMEQNYPNPGKDITYLSYKLPSDQDITLKVYDLYGKEIAVLIDHQKLNRGKHYQPFNISAHHLSPGVYFFHLIGENQTLVRRMIVE